MRNINPHKQTLSHSCLVADLLMLLKEKYNISFDFNDESDILIRGMKRTYPFYVVGIPKEFFKKYGKKVNIVVDNKYFTNILINGFKDKKNFNIYHNIVTINYIKGLLKERPIICHVDDNYLGDYSHASHFIILEKASTKKITIIDPMSGKRSLISDKKLEESILSLKKHIKMCPLLFYL
ncbi:MAG: hypothetical protein Q8N99_04305 [Nanoarchaeota archaeon]|nr:hypothetical protein [Nanoarchaeota archaeon]